jgi:hypothetical protein
MTCKRKDKEGEEEEYKRERVLCDEGIGKHLVTGERGAGGNEYH